MVVVVVVVVMVVVVFVVVVRTVFLKPQCVARTPYIWLKCLNVGRKIGFVFRDKEGFSFSHPSRLDRLRHKSTFLAKNTYKKCLACLPLLFIALASVSFCQMFQCVCV